jgi:hypothetical protein
MTRLGIFRTFGRSAPEIPLAIVPKDGFPAQEPFPE